MEFTGSTLRTYNRPGGAFREFFFEGQSTKTPDLHCSTWPSSDPPKEDDLAQMPWNLSFTNPQNRMDSLDPVAAPKWRIDGSTNHGTQLHVLPTFLLPQLPPLRIDIYIPNQLEHPERLRDALQSCLGAHVHGKRCRRLGISQHVLRVLERWTADFPNFEFVYKKLPFGSRIVIDRITGRLSDMNIEVIPSRDLEAKFITVEELGRLWHLDKDDWPPILSVNDLEIRAQLHDTISIVHIPQLPASELLVFKSTVESPMHLYHELKILLNMPPHSNIIARPLFIVVTTSDLRQREKVCGFILPYYRQGSLRDNIPYRACTGRLWFEDQLRWARQIVSMLIHVNEKAGRFYSDLKLDNLLLSTSGDVVCIDFEQRGNWVSYTAPEVLYLDWLQAIVRVAPHDERSAKYSCILRGLMPLGAQATAQETAEQYANPIHGYYRTWISLPADEQEAAEVFSLGKVLWCIFEGMGSPTKTLSKSYTYESDIEFPEFKKTPMAVRELIKACTHGALEWNGRTPGIVRVGGMLFPRGKTGLRGEPLGQSSETREAAKAMWEQHFKFAEGFAEAQLRYRQGIAEQRDMQQLAYLRRPSLSSVLTKLEELEQ